MTDDALERLRQMNSQNRKPKRDDDGDADEHAPKVAVPVNDPLLAALRREHPDRAFPPHGSVGRILYCWQTAARRLLLFDGVMVVGAGYSRACSTHDDADLVPGVTRTTRR
jgi:hypothetical protein